MKTEYRWLALAIISTLVMIALIFSIKFALAHDASRPELNAWFDKLASAKGLCCSFADGYAVEDADWESKDGHYRVRIPKKANGTEMEWVDVPDYAVIAEPNRAGRTMVWPIYGYSGESIRCFMPGSMT